MNVSIKLVFVVLLCMLVSCSDNSGSLPKTGQFYDPQEQRTGNVYICTGNNSYAYHSNRNCFGIKSCSKRIKKVTIEEAEELGRTPCHFCHE